MKIDHCASRIGLELILVSREQSKNLNDLMN